MKTIAQLIRRLLTLLSGRNQRIPENVAEDHRLALKIVARLRTECEKQRARSGANKIA